MELVEQLRSKRGVTIRVERHRCPDSLRVPYLAVRYGKGVGSGKVAYFLENNLGIGYADLIKERFLDDRESLGRPIPERSDLF